MVIEESINSAYEAIRSNLLRSLLTALAIIIGTAAVISMIAIGSTAQNEIQKSMDSLGGKNVSVFAGQRKKRGVRSNWVPLTMDDAKALQKEREINWQVSPQMEDRKHVKFGDKNASLAINGTDGSYFSVEGHGFSYDLHDIARYFKLYQNLMNYWIIMFRKLLELSEQKKN